MSTSTTTHNSGSSDMTTTTTTAASLVAANSSGNSSTPTPSSSTSSTTNTKQSSSGSKRKRRATEDDLFAAGVLRDLKRARSDSPPSSASAAAAAAEGGSSVPPSPEARSGAVAGGFGGQLPNGMAGLVPHPAYAASGGLNLGLRNPYAGTSANAPPFSPMYSPAAAAAAMRGLYAGGPTTSTATATTTTATTTTTSASTAAGAAAADASRAAGGSSNANSPAGAGTIGFPIKPEPYWSAYTTSTGNQHPNSLAHPMGYLLPGFRLPDPALYRLNQPNHGGDDGGQLPRVAHMEPNAHANANGANNDPNASANTINSSDTYSANQREAHRQQQQQQQQQHAQQQQQQVMMEAMAAAAVAAANSTNNPMAHALRMGGVASYSPAAAAAAFRAQHAHAQAEAARLALRGYRGDGGDRSDRGDDTESNSSGDGYAGAAAAAAAAAASSALLMHQQHQQAGLGYPYYPLTPTASLGAAGYSDFPGPHGSAGSYGGRAGSVASSSASTATDTGSEYAPDDDSDSDYVEGGRGAKKAGGRRSRGGRRGSAASSRSAASSTKGGARGSRAKRKGGKSSAKSSASKGSRSRLAVSCRHTGCDHSSAQNQHRDKHELSFAPHRDHIRNGYDNCAHCQELVRAGLWKVIVLDLKPGQTNLKVSANSRRVLAQLGFTGSQAAKKYAQIEGRRFVVLGPNVVQAAVERHPCPHISCTYSATTRQVLKRHERSFATHREHVASCEAANCAACARLKDTHVWREIRLPYDDEDCDLGTKAGRDRVRTGLGLLGQQGARNKYAQVAGARFLVYDRSGAASTWKCNHIGCTFSTGEKWKRPKHESSINSHLDHVKHHFDDCPACAEQTASGHWLDIVLRRNGDKDLWAAVERDDESMGDSHSIVDLGGCRFIMYPLPDIDAVDRRCKHIGCDYVLPPGQKQSDLAKHEARFSVHCDHAQSFGPSWTDAAAACSQCAALYSADVWEKIERAD